MRSLLRGVRRRLVAARDAVDGRMHKGRRRRARARLRSLSPSSVIIICLGNVCRSPYAERVWKVQSGARTSVGSGGFVGPGRQPPDTAIEVARSRGIDHRDHVSKTLTPGLVRGVEAFFVFDRHNLRRLRATELARGKQVFRLGDFDPQWTGKRAIIDPWGKEFEEFENTFARIERCVIDALEALDRLSPSEHHDRASHPPGSSP